MCPFVCSAKKVTKLEDLLTKKDQEIKAMEDRHKRYLEKAKSVSSFVALIIYLPFLNSVNYSQHMHQF